MNKIYGYMRVSTIAQNDERQRVELEKYGVDKIFKDKISGKNFNRPGYLNLKKNAKEGDLIVLKSLDRLGRNYKEMINEWRYFVNEKKVDIIILDMPLLNTKNNKDPLGTLISDLVLGLLSYVAQNEFEMIKSRQKEGINLAKKRGVKFGRPIVPFTPDFEKYYDLYIQKKITRDKIMKELNIDSKTLDLQINRKRKQIYRNKIRLLVQ